MEKEKIEEMLEQIDLSELEELENCVTPASGCGCGGLC